MDKGAVNAFQNCDRAFTAFFYSNQRSFRSDQRIRAESENLKAYTTPNSVHFFEEKIKNVPNSKICTVCIATLLSIGVVYHYSWMS